MSFRRRPLLVPALALATALAGCAAPAAERPGPTAAAPAEAAVPAGLAEYYGQELAWTGCGADQQCADVTVPLDYARPDGETITVAVRRLNSAEDDSRVGSLLVNPGGPGTPGTDYAEITLAGAMFTEDLRAAYDIVGFDPRGTGDSTPVDCVDDAELDRVRAAQHDTDAPGGLAGLAAASEAIAQGCAERSGALLTEVDTISAARDMDVLRHLLGEAQLDYLGFSYGTYLGATYAEQFPENVGSFVLDGAMDPALSSHETVLGQARGFETALRAYVEDCLGGAGCPLSGSVDDGVEQVRTLLEVTEDTPLPTSDGRELTAPLAFAGIITPLYNSATWFRLSQALDAAMRGDGSDLLFLADFMAGRTADGSYPDNTTEANWAINCADFGAGGDPETWAAQAAELEQASPTFGELLAYGDVLCSEWPGDPAGARGPLTAAGANPIMVVGTTGDPATPYEWSVSLAEQLESGFLVTYDGEGHTAYRPTNECIAGAVDAFLIDGARPAEGITC
ncbi:alpha/beta hydrolase [Georgenia sp. AZ-5]|uniref:alpha/beta hydrolase n=1 Tax=Georgenia sp. AZ-5 TaxID=3367526 RepID=UPI003754F6DB